MIGAVGEAAASPAGAGRRLLLLLDLRRRLVFRGPGRGVGARIFYLVMFAQLLMWASFLGFGVYELASSRPDLVGNLVRSIFFGVFVLQLMLGSMGVAVGEFYDTSRLLHLPVAPREIFAAMSFSALFAPGTIFVAAPIVGVLAAEGGSAFVIAARAGCFLAGVWFAHLASLTLGFVFLRFVSRRRFRDLATILGGVLGVAIYLGARAVSGRGTGADPFAVLASPRWEAIRLLPSQWFAEAFLKCEHFGAHAAGYLVLGFGGAALTYLAGAAVFRAGYDEAGESSHGGEVVADVRPGLARFLPPDVAAVVRSTYAVFRREPQLRALLIQQLVFFALPVVMQRGERDGGSFSTWLVALMIVLSHSALALSCFGVDGRGLGLLFAAPIDRRRLLFARLCALFGIFAAADVVAAVAITGVVRWMKGDFSGAALEAASLAGVTILGDVAQLACGAVISVVAPIAVIRTRRHGRTRGGREGCLIALGRLLALLPVALCTAAAAGVALVPRWFGLDPIYYFVTVPSGAAIAVGLFVAGVSIGARMLGPREGAVLDALADLGD